MIPDEQKETTMDKSDNKHGFVRISLVSERSRQVTDNPSFLFKWLQYAASNPYNKEKNPEGVVNLGTAENKLCEDLLVEKLSHPAVNQTEGFMNYYFTHYGDISFRTALKTFLEEKFHPSLPLDPENIIAACGCGAILDMLGFVLGEENDYFLIATPYYPRISNNLGERGCIRLYEVPLSSQLQPGDTAPFQLSAEKLETAYHRATKEGKNIRGVVLINPNNPLGDVYTEQQLTEILHFAARYQLHVLCDEIYALSTFDERSHFTSILSIKDMPDSDRVHFIWGFSKDFALAGYRCGLLYTTNQGILDYCKVTSYYQSVAMCVQIRLQNLVSDKEWRESVYFPTNLQRMRSHFDLCKARLAAMDVPLHPSKGGFYVWINMKQYLRENVTFEEETKLFEELIQNGVYCVPGRSMRCGEPGWFRLVFTVTTDELTAGLNRIEKTIVMRRKSDPRSSLGDAINRIKTIQLHQNGDVRGLQNGNDTRQIHQRKNGCEQTTTTPVGKLKHGDFTEGRVSKPGAFTDKSIISKAQPHSAGIPVYQNYTGFPKSHITINGSKTETQDRHVNVQHKACDENNVEQVNKSPPDENLTAAKQLKKKPSFFKTFSRGGLNKAPDKYVVTQWSKSETDLKQVSCK